MDSIWNELLFRMINIVHFVWLLGFCRCDNFNCDLCVGFLLLGDINVKTTNQPWFVCAFFDCSRLRGREVETHRETHWL